LRSACHVAAPPPWAARRSWLVRTAGSTRSFVAPPRSGKATALARSTLSAANSRSTPPRRAPARTTSRVASRMPRNRARHLGDALLAPIRVVLRSITPRRNSSRKARKAVLIGPLGKVCDPRQLRLTPEPRVDRTQGDRTQGDRTQGDRTQGDRTQGAVRSDAGRVLAWCSAPSRAGPAALCLTQG